MSIQNIKKFKISNLFLTLLKINSKIYISELRENLKGKC